MQNAILLSAPLALILCRSTIWVALTETMLSMLAPLILLIAAFSQPFFQRYLEMNFWRHGESKRLGNLQHIELVNIEDVLEFMLGISLHVRAVRLSRSVVKEVILLDQLL